MFKNWKKFGIAAIAVLILTLPGCAGDAGNEGGESNTGESNTGDSVGEALNHTITGIDAGAGVVQAAERAVEDYDLEFTVQTSSGAAMTQALADAIANEEPVVVTGWSPHWKFAQFDLKYLEDPKGSFGEAEHINTVVRLGLKDDMPEAYTILDNFYWEHEDSESVMMEIYEGGDPAEVARQWVDDNQEKVSAWTDGTEPVDGVEIELAYVAWDTEIASSNVIGTVLEDMGFDVSLTQVENGPMWEAIASGNADASVAAWLPGTHGEHYENYEGEFEDLGPNLEDAKIGLVVPSYMDINSIEDLVK